jgi:hypothetical protein
MTNAVLRRLFLILSLTGTPNLVLAGNCAALESSGPAWFSAQLEAAQTTFQTGNNTDAYAQLRQAATGLPRRADVSLDARCVGPTLWQRYYVLRSTITQSLGQAAEKSGQLTDNRGALDWYVTGDNQTDASRIIAKLTATPKGATWIIGRLRSEIETLNYAITAGFELLPDERSALAFWQRELDDTIGYAKTQVTAVLQAENDLITRKAQDEELQTEEFQAGIRNMAAGLFGETSLAPETEALRKISRASGSLNLLETAREWATAASPEDASPVTDRALDRGDALMATASSSEFGLESRESLYEAADNYFEFCNNHERRLAVENALAKLTPALEAEREQRNARISKQAEKMKASAVEMSESMIKTDTQKNDFKDEAEALEAELGF